MRLFRWTVLGCWITALSTSTMAVLVLVSPAAEVHAAESRARPVTPDRWMRSVFREVSTWLTTRGEVEARISETLGALAGDLRAQRAKTRLTRATARGVDASDRLVNEVKSVGTPNINGGKQIESGFLKALSAYGHAYKQARAEFIREKTPDKQQFAIAAQQINGRLVPKVSTDPMEGLRGVPELAVVINGYCGDVASYLAAKIDPSCRVALDTTQHLVDVENQYGATPGDSPDGDALLVEEDRVLGQLRTQLGGCNVAGLPGPCRKVFETAQHLADVDNQAVQSAEGSAQSQALYDELARQFDVLRSDVTAVCR
jgi:hypothetical protein